MYNKLDGLFLCLRDSETPSANLGEKSRSSLNNVELRNATNNSVALGPFEIWSATTGLLHSFGSDSMLPARSAIQLNQYAETENLPIEDLILVNCETQEFVSKTELLILPTDFPGLMPIGAWEQKKRIPTDQSIPCFTAGTLIATRDGQKRIADLRPGDHVITRDSGFVQVQAISQQSYSRAEQRL
ncbi:Hint domain-containing protein, partial [Ascidiaceihabitans sp.]|nr:Hint domain-containing protein [Ascidiaceihabitans sp.]